jgi:endonuclease-3
MLAGRCYNPLGMPHGTTRLATQATKVTKVTKATRRPRRGPWPPDPARVRSIVEGLEELYPDVDCELDRETPFQLLCATILSAQCTDERVNMVTPELFRRYPTPAALARAPLPTLQKIIRTTGFFRQKAKSLKGSAAALLARFGGEIPKTIEELTSLPGVARKTANVVLGTAFGIADGVVVDTHIQRLATRLGLTRATDPKDIERDLMKVLPRETWIRAGHQLIWHGRRVCFARKPNCAGCTLAPFCPSAGLEA